MRIREVRRIAIPARMLSFLPPVVRGVIAMTLLVANTLFWCSLLFAFSLIKLVFPAKRVRAVVDRVLNAIATGWIAGNSGWMRLTQRASGTSPGSRTSRTAGGTWSTATTSRGSTSSCSSTC